jgi:hypothetical protein
MSRSATIRNDCRAFKLDRGVLLEAVRLRQRRTYDASMELTYTFELGPLSLVSTGECELPTHSVHAESGPRRITAGKMSHKRPDPCNVLVTHTRVLGIVMYYKNAPTFQRNNSRQESGDQRTMIVNKIVNALPFGCQPRGTQDKSEMLSHRVRIPVVTVYAKRVRMTGWKWL